MLDQLDSCLHEKASNHVAILRFELASDQGEQRSWDLRFPSHQPSPLLLLLVLLLML